VHTVYASEFARGRLPYLKAVETSGEMVTAIEPSLSTDHVLSRAARATAARWQGCESLTYLSSMIDCRACNLANLLVVGAREGNRLEVLQGIVQ